MDAPDPIHTMIQRQSNRYQLVVACTLILDQFPCKIDGRSHCHHNKGHVITLP